MALGCPAVTGTGGSNRRLGRSAASVAALLVLAVLVVLVTRTDDRDRLTRARDLLADPGRFDTAEEAADTLAEVAELVFLEARDCEADHGDRADCLALASTSGFGQVLAVHTRTCTAPGRAEARQRMADLLAATASVPADGEVPVLPDLPRCS